MSEYKDLNLNRDTIDVMIASFLTNNGFKLGEDIQNHPNRKRIIFGAEGKDFATVDLHLSGNGTTTIQWKMGRNPPLGEQLAIALKGTIDPAEFETVNYSLRGITSESIDSIIELLGQSEDIQVNTVRDEATRKQVTFKSIAHNDSLHITHHRQTLVLQVQGKPLTCYRRIIFMLTDLLDLKGLEQVLYRKDDSTAEIVRKEMAEDYLKNFLPSSYGSLPENVKKLLISGCCVRLAAPVLPDYSLLLYPDLRSLEGVLKKKMIESGLSVDQSREGFGEFFEFTNQVCTFRQSYAGVFTDPDKERALTEGYSFYRKHRHTLFHMEEFTGASRMVDTLDKAISLSKDTYAAIDRLYT